MKHRNAHIPEDELIAYQMQESDRETLIAEHLERCAECAALAESIAETLRVFSAEPVPRANLDHAWQRLRGALPPLPAPQPRRTAWARRLSWGVPAAVLALLLAGIPFRERRSHRPTLPAYANHHVGPLTEQPVSPADAASMNAHIDSAERLLTEVNHASGPLDGSVRAQAHELLLSNALYVQQAHAQGALAQASLLEDLGRVLTTLDHEQEPDQERGRGWHLRLQMNTDGLLLDLRILQQNDQQQNDRQSKDTQ